MNNNKIKADLNKKIDSKKMLFKDIELKQNASYLAKHKTEYYSKFIEELKEKSNICNHFSTEFNEDLTKTDYEVTTIYYNV